MASPHVARFARVSAPSVRFASSALFVLIACAPDVPSPTLAPSAAPCEREDLRCVARDVPFASERSALRLELDGLPDQGVVLGDQLFLRGTHSLHALSIAGGVPRRVVGLVDDGLRRPALAPFGDELLLVGGGALEAVRPDGTMRLYPPLGSLVGSPLQRAPTIAGFVGANVFALATHGGGDPGILGVRRDLVSGEETSLGTLRGGCRLRRAGIIGETIVGLCVGERLEWCSPVEMPSCTLVRFGVDQQPARFSLPPELGRVSFVGVLGDEVLLSAARKATPDRRILVRLAIGPDAVPHELADLPLSELGDDVLGTPVPGSSSVLLTGGASDWVLARSGALIQLPLGAPFRFLGVSAGEAFHAAATWEGARSRYAVLALPLPRVDERD